MDGKLFLLFFYHPFVNNFFQSLHPKTVIPPKPVGELVFVPSSFDDQFLIDKKDRKPRRNAEPQVIIFTYRKSFIKEPNNIKNLFPQHNRGRTYDTKGKAFFKNPT